MLYFGQNLVVWPSINGSVRFLMKFIALTISLFAFSFGFSQNLPFDFSNSNQVFTTFGGSSFSISTDPSSGSNKVAQLTNSGSSAWEGFTVNLSKPVDLDLQKTLSLNFHRTDGKPHTLLLKLENGINPDVEVAVSVAIGTSWAKDLVFDFSKAVYSASQAAVNAQGIYNKLTLFVDGGVSIAGTYLVDDISNGSTATNPNNLDVFYTDLVWYDEFDNPGPVNTATWHHQTQVIVPGSGWANGEAQHYTNRTDNSYVDNAGFLHIVAKKENYTDQGLTKQYTSARLNSKFAFTYGRIDVRAKLPLEAGTWPAIWTLGKNINEDGGYWDAENGTTNWPACGEIDIMEHGIFKGQNINYISSAIHTTCCYGGNPNQGGTLADDLANNFHVYSMNWSPNQITFLLDGVAFYTYRPAVKNLSTWHFFEDQYILLNVAMGGIAGNIDPAFKESAMLIDYVRVYQNFPASTDRPNGKSFQIRVYPNPVKDLLHIKADQKATSLTVYDLAGKPHIHQTENTSEIDVSNLVPGIYLLEVYSGQQRVVRKIQIE